MDDGYTPTTEDVRWAYSIDAEWEHRDPINAGANRELHRRQFDRWLAQHDAGIGKAISEGILRNCMPPGNSYPIDAASMVTVVANWVVNPPDWVDAPWAGRGK